MFETQFSASLWGDEAFSAVLSAKPFWQMIKIVSRDTSPPLYYICEFLWFRLFGNSEIAIRTLSFLFFLGTVLTVALIAKEIGRKKTIFWASLLTFLNPFLFRYAFEGRMYSILAFTTTLSFYCFIKVLFIKSKQKLKWQVFYVLSAATALYSHHFAIFAIFVQGMWSLITSLSSSPPPRSPFGHLGGVFRRIPRTLWVYPAILLLYAPWLPSLYYQTTLVGSGFWLATPKLKDLSIVLRSFIVGPEKYALRNFAYLLVGILLIVRRWKFIPLRFDFLKAVAYAYRSFQYRNSDHHKELSRRQKSKLRRHYKLSMLKAKGHKQRLDWILLSWLLAPILLTFIVSQFYESIFFDRYLLFSIPAIALLLATRRKSIISPALLLILVGIFAYYNWFYFIHPTKRPFKEFSAFMKSEFLKGGKIINWNSSAHHLWESKYYGIPGPIYSSGGPLPFYVGTAQMTDNDVIYELPDVDRLGIITSGPIEEVSLQNYQLVESKQFGELKGLWFQKEKNQ